MNVSALLSRGPYLVRLRGALDSAVRGRIGGSESVRGAALPLLPPVCCCCCCCCSRCRRVLVSSQSFPADVHRRFFFFCCCCWGLLTTDFRRRGSKCHKGCRGRLVGSAGSLCWRGHVRAAGPQLARAMVSMTCSSLPRSRCLRDCSSFCSAERIWTKTGRKGKLFTSPQTVARCKKTQTNKKTSR